jgi:hypothetical protein
MTIDSAYINAAVEQGGSNNLKSTSLRPTYNLSTGKVPTTENLSTTMSKAISEKKHIVKDINDSMLIEERDEHPSTWTFDKLTPMEERASVHDMSSGESTKDCTTLTSTVSTHSTEISAKSIENSQLEPLVRTNVVTVKKQKPRPERNLLTASPKKDCGPTDRNHQVDDSKFGIETVTDDYRLQNIDESGHLFPFYVENEFTIQDPEEHEEAENAHASAQLHPMATAVKSDSHAKSYTQKEDIYDQEAETTYTEHVLQMFETAALLYSNASNLAVAAINNAPSAISIPKRDESKTASSTTYKSMGIDTHASVKQDLAVTLSTANVKSDEEITPNSSQSDDSASESSENDSEDKSLANTASETSSIEEATVVNESFAHGENLCHESSFDDLSSTPSQESHLQRTVIMSNVTTRGPVEYTKLRPSSMSDYTRDSHLRREEPRYGNLKNKSWTVTGTYTPGASARLASKNRLQNHTWKTDCVSFQPKGVHKAESSDSGDLFDGIEEVLSTNPGLQPSETEDTGILDDASSKASESVSHDYSSTLGVTYSYQESIERGMFPTDTIRFTAVQNKPANSDLQMSSFRTSKKTVAAENLAAPKNGVEANKVGAMEIQFYSKAPSSSVDNVNANKPIDKALSSSSPHDARSDDASARKATPSNPFDNVTASNPFDNVQDYTNTDVGNDGIKPLISSVDLFIEKPERSPTDATTVKMEDSEEITVQDDAFLPTDSHYQVLASHRPTTLAKIDDGLQCSSPSSFLGDLDELRNELISLNFKTLPDVETSDPGADIENQRASLPMPSQNTGHEGYSGDVVSIDTGHVQTDVLRAENQAGSPRAEVNAVEDYRQAAAAYDYMGAIDPAVVYDRFDAKPTNNTRSNSGRMLKDPFTHIGANADRVREDPFAGDSGIFNIDDDDNKSAAFNRDHPFAKASSRRQRSMLLCIIIFSCLAVIAIVITVPVLYIAKNAQLSAGSMTAVQGTSAPSSGPSPSSTWSPSVVAGFPARSSGTHSSARTHLPTKTPSGSPVHLSNSSVVPTNKPKQCFQGTAELRQAVDVYLSGSKGSKSTVSAAYGASIGDWCVASISDFSELFSIRRNPLAQTFNEPIGAWNVSSAKNMNSMFLGAVNFQQDISSWRTDNVKDMSSMLSQTSFNGVIESWNVSRVHNFAGMFQQALFDGSLAGWDTRAATNMSQMFDFTKNFKGIGLSTWQTPRVIDFSAMFRWSEKFNEPLISWNVRSATYADSMFMDAMSYDQPMSLWDVRNVVSARGMLQNAISFHQNLCLWGTLLSNATNVTSMFKNAMSCDSMNDPSLHSNPRGPFCAKC